MTRLGPKFAALAALLLLTAVLAACGSSSSSSDSSSDTGGGDASIEEGRWGATINSGGEPVEGGVLRIDTVNAPEDIDPIGLLQRPQNEGIQVAAQMFDQLVEIKPGSLELQPGLAKSWEVSKDGRTITFHLRDAKFSNGMPVTSADVKYMVEFARGPKSFAPENYEAIEKVETPDPKTAVLKLSHPAPGLLYILSTVPSSITPSKYVEEVGLDGFKRQPIGTGPFMLKQWHRGQEVDLVPNPGYWGEGPYLDEVQLIATPNDNTRVLDIQSKKVDVSDYIPFSQVETIDSGDSAKVLVAPGADMNVIWLNNADKPFDEMAVRQALNYATPVDSIVKTVFAGVAPRMNTVIPKLKYWTADSKAYPYDPEKAKELLAESSVPNGFSTTLQIEGGDSASEQVAQIVQAAWEEIGVKVKIETLDNTTRGDNYINGDYEMTYSRPGEFTSDTPTDDEFATLMFDSPAIGNLFTSYKNPKLPPLVEKATTSLNEAERKKLFAEIHVLSMEDPPVVPIVYTPNRAAVADTVHNFSYMLGGYWLLGGTWLE